MAVSDPIGVMGSSFRTGAYLLPAGAPNRKVFSGELYMPKTSARASFVANVTVGSEYVTLFILDAARLTPRMLPSGEETGESYSCGEGGGGGAHFLPSSPIDFARAS